MPSPTSVKTNDYHKKRKRNDIYTPVPLAQFVFDLLSIQDFETVLDPAVGAGALTNPWRDSGRTIIGCDINLASRVHADIFLPGQFQDIKDWSSLTPDLVLCNPPFNSAQGGDLYPEIFLRHLVSLFGKELPIALFCPMGLRLNQRLRSARWRWLRDSGPQITDIIGLPLDIFPNVEFHVELLLFNLPGIEHHAFLPQKYVNQLLQGNVRVNAETGLYYLDSQKSAHRLKNALVMSEAAAIEAGYVYAHERPTCG